MPLEPFKASAALSIGVELELQLVDTTDFDLTPAASDLLFLLERLDFPGDVKPEITESMIEIASDVHCHYLPLLEQLRRMRDVLVKAGDRLNIAVSGGGTHPFQLWFEQRIHPKPRFQEISALYGYLAKQFTVFGLHVHIGCPSADEALYLMHGLNRYVPHFIALSASSPYFQGVDTLFESARLNVVSAFPLSGRAPFILRWAQFEDEYFAKMEATGMVKSMKDFYWDIRPKPEYGTIELRVCDTPLTVERAAALAAYLQALCRMLLAREEPAPAEDDYLVYNYNRFQACRFGLDGILLHPKSHQKLSLREDILATLRCAEPHALALEAVGAFDELYAVAAGKGSDAHWLRQQAAQAGIVGMVESALQCFRGGRET